MLTPPSPHITITRLVVRPNDMDADRNVSNSVYFDYFYQARLEHLRRLGVYDIENPQYANLFAWPRSWDRPLYDFRGGLKGAGASSTEFNIAANIERGF